MRAGKPLHTADPDRPALWRHRTEAERLEAALAAHPSDIDLLLRLARARVVEGNFLRAAAAAQAIIDQSPELAEPHAIRAVSLRHIDPVESRHSADRAAALGEPIALDEEWSVEPALAQRPRIWVDLTDFMDYVSVNVTLSGIQRVVANFLRSVHASAAYRESVRIVVPNFKSQKLLAVDLALVVELIDAVEIYNADREYLDRLLLGIKTSLKYVEPLAGDVFLMPGAFWISHNYDLLKLLRGRGIHVTLFIHDLIQINNPGYVQPEATEVFRRSLVDVLEVASFVTTNSEFVAKEVRRFLQAELQLDCPVKAVPLATEISVVTPNPADEAMLLERFGPNGYVLCVCTIEVRKNHAYLTAIWEQLIVRGRTDVPALVLVGKWGWEIEPFRRHLGRTNNLNGIAHVMSGVSDRLLTALYRQARFTLYPSFAEGWGLPVGESLVLGRPCLASGVTSIPEVGGSLVRYFDPLDVETGFEAVSRLLDHPDDLARWEAQVQAEFRPRTWREFSVHLMQTTWALAEEAGRSRRIAFARLLPGEMIILGGDAVTASAGQHRTMRTGRMARVEGWHHVEFDGAWMKEPRGTIRFIASECRPGEVIELSVELAGTNQLLTCALRTSAGLSAYVPISTTGNHRMTHSAQVDADGAVEFTIIAQGHATRFADRDNYARLVRFGYMRQGNRQDRTRLMEAALLE